MRLNVLDGVVVKQCLTDGVLGLGKCFAVTLHGCAVSLLVLWHSSIIEHLWVVVF